ncbi:solute carrier family 49 member 4 homolog [Sycon ciliatum]|uniref:solute carrier family 49 member 4 homolog n=1 Tax=Sycon ciliatum TaxID=27933 RepID=UPI0020AE6C82|eukprot:scpid51048/ scgid14886/ Disrupted in renal carcinoma protein 2 homolog
MPLEGSGVSERSGLLDSKVRTPDALEDVLNSNDLSHSVTVNGSSASNGNDHTTTTTSTESSQYYRTYKSRFLVLFIFSLTAIQQDQIWITFGIIAKQTEDYYDVSSSEVDLLAAWGPIMFIPSMFFCSWLLERRGIRDTIFVAVLLELIGAGVRVFAPPGRRMFGLIHLGQILNGIAGPLIMAPPAKLSAVWFPPHQRTTATAIGTMAPYVGSAVAFLFIPFLANTYGMQTMLLWQFILTGVIALCVAVYFPEAPPTPPSASSEVQRVSLKKCWSKVKGNPTFWILSICGGVTSGVFNAWASILSIILNSSDGFTDSSSIHVFFRSTSWIGFASSLLGIIVACVAGPVADFFPGRLKRIILFLFGSAGVLYIWFSMAVEGWLHFAPALQSTKTVFVTAVLGSTFLNAANPLFYEACVEATYPVPEGISVMVLIGLNNFSCLVFQAAGMAGFFDKSHPGRAKAMNWLMTGMVVGCWFLSLFYKEEYRRMKVDDANDDPSTCSFSEIDTDGGDSEHAITSSSSPSIQ